MKFPDGYRFSSRSPSKREIIWLYEWLVENKDKYKIKNILEFSCGITTWALCEALDPNLYVAVDDYKHLVKFVETNLPKVHLVSKWEDIPSNKYDIVLIDGSTGFPSEVKVDGRGVYRVEACEYSVDMMADNALIIMHDWRNKRGGWRRLRKHLDENYKFVDGCKIGYGFGIYQK